MKMRAKWKGRRAMLGVKDIQKWHTMYTCNKSSSVH
jgi:hypothetical protein